jgi:hypothetical protein
MLGVSEGWPRWAGMGQKIRGGQVRYCGAEENRFQRCAGTRCALSVLLFFLHQPTLPSSHHVHRR